MDSLVLNLLNAIAFSLILFVMASGLSLVFGTMGVLNLAHGAIYMVGAYCGFTMASMFGDFYMGLAGAALGAGVLGLVLERAFLRQLYKRQNDQVLLTLGFVYMAGNLVEWIWGPLAKMGTIPSQLSGFIGVGEATFPAYRIAVIGIGIVIAVGLWLLLERTPTGSIIRAGMENKEIVASLGINYELTCTGLFVAGAALAGFGGFVGMPIVGVNPNTSLDILLYGLIVVVVGGVGSVEGTLVGSLIIGFIDTFGKAYLPDFSMFFMYLALLVILVVKPSGLLARRV